MNTQTTRCGTLKCLYLNARSIVNKIDSLAAIVSDIKPDIIGVTESWATDNITDVEISIPGYTLFRTDRQTDNKGGGVLLYVLSTLKPASYYPQAFYPEHLNPDWINSGLIRKLYMIIVPKFKELEVEVKFIRNCLD